MILHQPFFRLNRQAPSGSVGLGSALLLGLHLLDPRSPAFFPRARCQVFQHLLPGISHTPLKGPVFPSPPLKITKREVWRWSCCGDR